MNKKLLGLLKADIIEAVNSFNLLHKKMQKSIKDNSLEIRHLNERPIAGYINDFLLKKGHDAKVLTFDMMHELPIKGLDEEKIGKIKDYFIKLFSMKRNEITKQYKLFEVDGYLDILIDETNIKMYIEYKSERKNSPSFLRFAADLLKFIIYSNETNNETFLMYISLLPDGDSFKNILESEINIIDKKFNKDILDNNRVLIMSSKLFTLPTKNNIYLEQAIIQEISNNQDLEDSIPTEDSPVDYDNLLRQEWFEKSQIYGKHVIQAYKIRKNMKIINDIHAKIQETYRMSDDVAGKYDKISNFISMVMNRARENGNGTTARFTEIHHNKNWLLAAIECYTKIQIPNWYKNYKQDQEWIFEVKEVNKYGVVSNDSNAEEEYQNMILEVENILNETDNTEKVNIGNFYLVINHLNKYYEELMEYSETYNTYIWKSDYQNFKIKRRLKDLNGRLYKELIGAKRMAKDKNTYENITDDVKVKINSMIKKD